MAATGRSTEDALAPSDVATRLREAEFVRLVGTATAPGLAASGVLARTLLARDRPFQISLSALGADAERATEADCTVAVGRRDPAADVSLAGPRPVSALAFDVAREFMAAETGSTDPMETGTVVLALAGHADGETAVEGPLGQAADAAGIDRRPGVAIPTRDPVDGLAHSTLVHAPFSGDREATREAIEPLSLATESDAGDAGDRSDTERRRLASMAAIRTTGTEAAVPRAGRAIANLCRPFVGGPFETVGGYRDILDVLARTEPGTGIALALGQDVRESALETWRSHARRAHAAVREATTRRYDGLYVARITSDEAALGTVTRLLHDYRSPESRTLAVADGAARLRASEGEDVAAIASAAAEAVDAHFDVDDRTARFEIAGAEEDFVSAIREVRPE